MYKRQSMDSVNRRYNVVNVLSVKDNNVSKVEDVLELHFPGIREQIQEYYTSTPLTYLDYTGTAEGSMPKRFWETP